MTINWSTDEKNGLNLWKLSHIWKEILNDKLNWIEYIFLNLIQLNTIQLNWIQNQSKKNEMQIGGKGLEIKIYSWTWSCKKKLSKIYKYKKSHLHASLHGNGLNVFQFGIV